MSLLASDGLLARSRIVAPASWNRWLVPPAALSIHLAIGQAYAWSVFKPPLEASLHLDGTQSALPFQLAIVMLGLSAAFGGTLVERNGPRWAMAVATACFSCGFLVAALGAETRQYWLVVLGYGVIGGCGLMLMTMGLFAEHGLPEAAFTISGVILVATAHIRNLRHAC